MNPEENSTVRLKRATIRSLKALRNSEFDETIEEVIQRLLTFYLSKPSESKKSAKRKNH